MKKFIILAFIGFFSFAFTQTSEEVAQSSAPLNQMGNNEVKVNILYSALGIPEITYERLLNDNSAVGLSVGFSVEKPEDMAYRYGITPYYRMYFGFKKASGFFIEANGILLGHSYDEYDGTGASLSSETQSQFGLGAGVGAKFLSRNGLIGEVYGGLGRVFGDNSLGAYPRFGISLGKRF